MPSHTPHWQESTLRLSPARKTICFAILTSLAWLTIASYHLRTSGKTLAGLALSPVSHASHHFDSLCDTFPDPGNVAVVVKTGATELHAKVPVLLDTSLRCVKEPILVSDLDQKLDSHQVHDVLSDFSSHEMRFNPDFDLYRLQKEYMRTGREADIDELRMYPAASKIHGHRKAAWILDRYKFIYMIKRSWEIQPSKEWYFYMDADTYLHWPNFLRWLPHLDPGKMQYIGHSIGLKPYPTELELSFAHGGAGFLLSGATVQAFASRLPSIAKAWEARIARILLGDAALGVALAEELETYLTDGQLSMTENEPNNTAFGGARWCRPILTLHHLKTEGHALSVFDAKHKSAATFRDLYHFNHPEPFEFPEVRENWDNQVRDDGSWDWGTSLAVKTSIIGRCHRDSRLAGDPHCSFEACRQACEQNQKCMQFLFRTTVLREDNDKMVTECSHSDAFRMGRERRVEIDMFDETQEAVGVKYKSGWMTERIAEWVNEHRECKEEDLIWPGV